VTTADRVILAALLSQEGTVTVNRAATARLLADRLALLRHLIVAEIPVPETIVSFGEAATLQALESLGYPALLLPVQAGPAASEAIVHDADAGEAIVEHRGMLGHETAVLVQRQARGSLVRLAVVGTTIVGAELVCTTQTGSPHHAPYDRFSPALDEIAERVIGRLGSGVYEIRVVETINGPLVVGAGNLVDFRSLSQAGIDIAGQIADFALSQHALTVGEREIRRG
jgi:[lysine-biosynthesis-protein LysW]---L-2-aminoadipate ligase